MGLRDLFKSNKERERETKRKRRKAFREAENAVDAVKDRAKKLKSERDRAWAEARQYMKDGQKAAAQRSLQACRANEMMISKLDQKQWVFEQLLTKLELAKTDQDFSQSLAAINTVVEIDPEQVADVLDEVNDKLGEQVDTDRIWERAHDKEMEGVAEKMTDVIPSLEDMESQLMDEVAAEIGGGQASEAAEHASGSKTEQIGEGHRRLKDLLEDEK
jgi:hypothetical protein